MLTTFLVGIASLSNFGTINNIFNDFYTKVETVQVTKTPKKVFNFHLNGNEVTKILNLDKEYPVLQTLNFNLSSDKGMWVKANLSGKFPLLDAISSKSNKADFTLKATGDMPSLTKIHFVTRSGDTFLDWCASGKKMVGINLHTRSGDTGLILNNNINAVNLNSRSGEMYLKWLIEHPESNLKIDTSSGDIHVELEKGLKSAAIHTKSGDIDLQIHDHWEVNSEFNVVTKTGDIIIDIPKDVNVVLNTTTITGDIESANLTETKVDNRTKVYVQQAAAGKPTITIHIESRTGDILLH